MSDEIKDEDLCPKLDSCANAEPTCTKFNYGPGCFKQKQEETPPSTNDQSAGPMEYSGWICPRCGAGVSPFVQTCPCVPIYSGPCTS